MAKFEKMKKDIGNKNGNDNSNDTSIGSHGKSEAKYKLASSSTSNGNTDNSKIEMEDHVLLINWRGRSHLHCSWERPSNLELYDTTNYTAKRQVETLLSESAYGLGERLEEGDRGR